MDTTERVVSEPIDRKYNAKKHEFNATVPQDKDIHGNTTSILATLGV